MAENILDEYHEALPGGISLIPSRGGVFEVELDGANLFSKRTLGRFPDPHEVEDALAARLGAK